MKALLLSALLLVSTSTAHAGARVELHDDTQEVVIKAHLNFYGPSAIPEFAQKVVDQINLYWNGKTNLPDDEALDLTATIQGKVYHLKTEVTGTIVTQDEAISLFANNDNRSEYFIKLLTHKKFNPFSSIDQFGRAGIFIDSEVANSPTTVPHEFGHGLGLGHAPIDLHGYGRPSIMAARGTKVDSQYQYDPQAAVNQKGGSIDPKWRRVLQSDVNNLKLDKLEYVDGVAVYGIRSNEIDLYH